MSISIFHEIIDLNDPLIIELISQITNLKNNINDIMELRNCTIKKKTNYISEWLLKIDSIANKLKNYIDTKHSYDNEIFPSEIDIKTINVQKNIYENEIQAYNEKLEILYGNLNKLIEISISPLRKNIIKNIMEVSFIKSSTCTICMQLNPLVDLNLPCRFINKDTKRPTCEGCICIICAHEIMGLTIKQLNNHNDIKCPICRTNSIKPTSSIDAYSIIMPIMRAVDSYLIFENSIFEKYFQVSLNIFQCSFCNNNFNTLSEYLHHLNGTNNNSDNSCYETNNLIYSTKLEPINNNNIWDNFAPVADTIQW